VKIQTQPEMLAKACEMLLDKGESKVRNVALQTLEGHQRAIMGLMTVEAKYSNYSKCSVAVLNEITISGNLSRPQEIR